MTDKVTIKMKFIYLLLYISILPNATFSQVFKMDVKDIGAKPQYLNEVSFRFSPDSVVFYYNSRYQLVKPTCSYIYRVAKIDSIKLLFSGSFNDYYSDSILAVEGKYVNGKKEGLFKFYYPNGFIEKIGNYANDKKIGKWEYYYEDSSKHQILDFKESEIMVIDFWNEKGKQLVNSGNGKWFGYETSEKFEKIEGKILNGKKHGKWSRTIPSQNFTVNEEKYKEGEFLGGTFISMLNGEKPYNNTSYCLLDQPDALLTAEKFELNSCYPHFDKKWEFASYPGEEEQFYKEIRNIAKEKNINSTETIIIQFTIDAMGNMINFKPLTNLGKEKEIISILESMKRWKPTKAYSKPVSQIKIINIKI